jgi:hypothetical protein
MALADLRRLARADEVVSPVSPGISLRGDRESDEKPITNQCVNRTASPVSPVSPGKHKVWEERAGLERVSLFETDADERAAIASEPPLPTPGNPERDRLEARQQQMLTGLQAAAALRPPSWWHQKPHNPAPGAVCSCCRGREWWSRDRLGWCCSGCKPAPPGCEKIDVAT